ncbi:hypothetical protein BDV25DRAFT_144200 [Aspergillus avenaceus]|uniref:Uncharacterized protein n=1 Tax=Aspergillus avenaceus TaxID=36643 RepID=A0A5N6THW5_ASPAV|nr:hypothetical protein BDV25DRAFT_144200 [Aspergillus avenaceus]
MSIRREPQQIIKKQRNQIEYSMLQEWAPQKLNEYPPPNKSKVTQLQPPAREPRREPVPKKRGYTAPNGTYICERELSRLSDGIKQSDCRVYFKPCFIEDPWKGLNFVKMPFTVRYCPPVTPPPVAQRRIFAAQSSPECARLGTNIGYVQLQVDPQKRQTITPGTEGGAEQGGQEARRRSGVSGSSP